MTVYVDDMKAKFRNMIMCHMIADTEHELHDMARNIGIARRWYQDDHYDITMSKRTLAVKLGAQRISWRSLSLMMVARRIDRNAPLLTPQDGMAALRIVIEERARRRRVANGCPEFLA